MQHEASVPTGWVAAEYGGNFRRLLVARRADIWRSQLQSVSLVSLLAARAHVWRRVKRAKPPAGSEGHESSLLHGTRAHAYYFFSVASLLLSNPQSEGRNRCSRPLSLSQEQSRVLRSKAKNAEKTSRTSFSGRAAPKPHFLGLTKFDRWFGRDTDAFFSGTR